MIPLAGMIFINLITLVWWSETHFEVNYSTREKGQPGTTQKINSVFFFNRITSTWVSVSLVVGHLSKRNSFWCRRRSAHENISSLDRGRGQNILRLHSRYPKPSQKENSPEKGRVSLLLTLSFTSSLFFIQSIRAFSAFASIPPSITLQVNVIVEPFFSECEFLPSIIAPLKGESISITSTASVRRERWKKKAWAIILIPFRQAAAHMALNIISLDAPLERHSR